MKSLLNIEEVKPKAIKMKSDRGADYTVLNYDELGVADVIARWLIDAVDSKTNKYIVCRDWDRTKSKEVMDRGINDLAADARNWCMTMTLLASATKNKAVIPSRDRDEQTLAEDYDIPAKTNLNALIRYPHRVGMNTLMASKEKFVVDTCVSYKYDPDCILSPLGCKAFIKELENSRVVIETQGYSTMNDLALSDLAGLFTGSKNEERFEATLYNPTTISEKLAQLLELSSFRFQGCFRAQESLSGEALQNWLRCELENNSNSNNK